MRQTWFIGFLWCMAFLFGGCVEPLTPVPSSQKVDFVLHISSAMESTLETKAETAENGDLFSNIIVFLVRDGKIVKCAQPEMTSDASTKDIPFTSVEVGTYEVYAIANYTDADLNGLVEDNTFITGKAFHADHLLQSVSNHQSPHPGKEGYMLLTGHTQAPVEVDYSQGDIVLYRTVARLNVYINNYTPKPVRLDNLEFSSFSAPTAYLFEHKDESGLPVMLPGTVLQDLPIYDLNNPVTIPVAPPTTPGTPSPERVPVYLTYLYEMQSVDVCQLNVKVCLLDGQTNPTLTSGLKPMNLVDNQTGLISPLTTIYRNQELNVEINIYYKADDARFGIEVYNDTWRTSSESTWIYN